ncbi:MAG: MMPL family transporter, partial [Chitinophagales bacterium]
MLLKSSKLILRYRLPILIVIGVFTLLMGYLARDLEIDYKMSKVVPKDHPKLIDYQNFRKKFGEDGNVIILAVEKERFFELDFYQKWAALGNELLELDGIEQFLGISNAYDFVKNKEEKKFELVHIPTKIPETQEEMKVLAQLLRDRPFYDKLLLDEEKGVTFMALTMDEEKIDSEVRVAFFKEFDEIINRYESNNHLNLHISGLPYIRNHKVETMKAELVIVLVYSVLILISILFFLFRSAYAVIFPVLVVGIGVIWCGGLLHVLDYKINVLTSLVPNLIVIIGIPNCVYLLNKYHLEFKKHGNKARALSRVIQKIGYVTFFANLTTAIGFGVFAFSDSGLLREFGIVAGIMISSIFLISLICIPIIFSYLPDPMEGQMKHLDRKALAGILKALNGIATRHRRKVYLIAALVIAFAISGSLMLQTRGFILDDVPHESEVYKDLQFVEKNFKGIMPLEILVDTKKPKGAMDLKFLNKIDQVQDSLFAHQWFSKPTSIVNGLKFSTQAYFNGNPAHYRLPKDNFMTPEMSFIMTYLKNSQGDRGLVNNFVDSTKQIARISTKIPDIGSDKLPELMQTLEA